MLNEKFWLAISFLSFLALIIKYVWPVMAKSIDGKSRKIAEDLMAAKELKEKAEKLLVDIEKLYKESLNFAEKLTRDAEIEAQKLAEESKKLLESELQKKTTAALERVKLEEERIIREIKLKVINNAMEILSKNFNLEQKNHEQLVEKSIKNFESIQ